MPEADTVLIPYIVIARIWRTHIYAVDTSACFRCCDGFGYASLARQNGLGRGSRLTKSTKSQFMAEGASADSWGTVWDARRTHGHPANVSGATQIALAVLVSEQRARLTYFRV
jgi:hypothetical protein